MEKKLIVSGALAGLILAGVAVGSVSAQTAGLSEEQAIAIALGEVAGEVQTAELETEDGVQVYEIEILAADGTEMEVEVNADTGEVLEVAAEDDDDDKEDCKDDDDEDDDEDDA